MLRVLTTTALTTALLLTPIASASSLSNSIPTAGSVSGSAPLGPAEGWVIGSTAYSPEAKEDQLGKEGYNEKDATAIAWGSISPDDVCPPPPAPGEARPESYGNCPDVPVTLGEWLSAIFHYFKVLLGLAEPAR